MLADAIAKFWVMPRTGTALSPVDSTSAGVTATKGFNLAADLIGGLPELEDQIGWTMVGTSGQARSERVAHHARFYFVFWGHEIIWARTPRRPVRLSSPQSARRASDRRPTPRLRHLRRAATQQAGKVSSAGNEGLSAGIVGSSGDGVGRRTAARPSP